MSVGTLIAVVGLVLAILGAIGVIAMTLQFVAILFILAFAAIIFTGWVIGAWPVGETSMTPFSDFIAHVLDLVSGAAGMTLGSFVLLVALDDLLGMLLAIKTHTFNLHKLPSWLASQFGTREALVLGGMIGTAFVGQISLVTINDISSAHGLEQLAVGLIKVVYSTATVGAGALALAVIADVVQKLSALFNIAPQPAPAPAEPAA